MKRFRYSRYAPLVGIFAAVLIFSQARIPGPGGSATVAPAGQLWSAILSALRAMDWSQNGATIVNRTIVCSSIAPYTGTAATINAAFAACPANEVVQLQAGTFHLSTSIINTTSNITLRGAGTNQTFIVMTGTSTNCNGVGATSICNWNGDSGSFQGGAGTGNIANWTAGFAQNATALTFSNTTGLVAGTIVILTQNDDPADTGNVYVCQTHGADHDCSQQGGGGVAKAGAAQVLNVTVVSVIGSTVNVTPGLPAPNWSGAKAPTGWWSNHAPVVGFGIEDLSVDYSNIGSAESGIEFHMARNCWIKHLRSINGTSPGGATHKHVNLYDSNHCTVRDSYFYGASPTSEGYGVDNDAGSSFNLAENNITQHLPTGEINETSCCNVFGYGYAVDNFYNGGGSSPNWQQQDGFHHGGGDHLILWEGKEGIGFDGDDIHGTSFFLTHNRVYLNGRDPATETGIKNQSTFSYFPFAFARYNQIIGSVLGTASYHTHYQTIAANSSDCGSGPVSSLSVFVFDYSDQGGVNYSPGCIGAAFIVDNDAHVSGSQVRWGNYAACTGDAACNVPRFQTSEDGSSAPVYPGLNPPSNTLPTSFYLHSKPAFLGSRPWPLVGPDVTGGNIANVGGHANHNAAADCYLNTMGGQVDGSSGPLAFDPPACGY